VISVAARLKAGNWACSKQFARARETGQHLSTLSVLAHDAEAL
jgi:hypothetical protein